MRTFATMTLAMLVGSLPALAHGEEGEMTVLAAEVGADLTVTLEVGVVFADDGHFAEEATVEAELTASDGTRLEPVTLDRISGARYGATVSVPHADVWSVSITSTNPEAEAETSVTVPEPPPATSTTTTPATTTTTTTTTPVTSTTATSTTASASAADGGGGWAPLVLMVATVGAMTALALAVSSRRRRAADYLKRRW